MRPITVKQISTLIAKQLGAHWLVSRYGPYTLSDEIVLGIGIARTGSDILQAHVYIRPLYWPSEDGMYGICAEMSVWSNRARWLWPRSQSGAEISSQELVQLLLSKVLPRYQKLVTGEMVLRFHKSHPLDPLLGWRKEPPTNEIMGYIAAWCGHTSEARARFEQELRLLKSERADWAEEQRAQLKEILGLLGSPEELREKLESNCNANRINIYRHR